MVEREEIKYENYYKKKLTLMYPDEIIKFEVPMFTTHVRADAVLLRDPITAFEIKTERDSLDRLKNQVRNYFKIFPHVCVVAHESKAEKAAEIVSCTCAEVWSVDNDGTVKTIVSGGIDRSHIDNDAVFAFLRKEEQKYILQKYFHELPFSTDFNRYRDWQEMFRQLPTEVVLKEMSSMCYLRWHDNKKSNDFWGLE